VDIGFFFIIAVKCQTEKDLVVYKVSVKIHVCLGFAKCVASNRCMCHAVYYCAVTYLNHIVRY